MAPISLYSQQECSLQLDILKRKTISNNNSYFIKDSVTIWGINYRFQGFYANGSGKYIHVMFVHFTLCAPRDCFLLEILLYVYPVQE